jgi:hypothetical protein
MDKIVLIEKYNASSIFWPYLLKNNALPESGQFHEKNLIVEFL